MNYLSFYKNNWQRNLRKSVEFDSAYNIETFIYNNIKIQPSNLEKFLSDKFDNKYCQFIIKENGNIIVITEDKTYKFLPTCTYNTYTIAGRTLDIYDVIINYPKEFTDNVLLPSTTVFKLSNDDTNISLEAIGNRVAQNERVTYINDIVHDDTLTMNTYLSDSVSSVSSRSSTSSSVSSSTSSTASSNSSGSLISLVGSENLLANSVKNNRLSSFEDYVKTVTSSLTLSLNTSNNRLIEIMHKICDNNELNYICLEFDTVNLFMSDVLSNEILVKAELACSNPEHESKAQAVYKMIDEVELDIIEKVKIMRKYGFVHNDIHYGNLGIVNNKLVLIDFDDSYLTREPSVADVETYINHVYNLTTAQDQYVGFIKGVKTSINSLNNLYARSVIKQALKTKLLEKSD